LSVICRAFTQNTQSSSSSSSQATLAASRQSSPSSGGSPQTTSATAVCSHRARHSKANVTPPIEVSSPVGQAAVTSGATASGRPVGAPATSTISQSVLLSGAAGGQGQMYLRVSCGSLVIFISKELHVFSVMLCSGFRKVGFMI